VKKYIIEREIPDIGTLSEDQLREAAATSNEALEKLGADIQWLESFVAADKTFCVYLAKDEEIIRHHARLSGFPANKITEIGRMLDSTDASAEMAHCFGATSGQPSR
jgi:methionine synthase I (cobalamin-dependent)